MCRCVLVSNGVCVCVCVCSTISLLPAQHMEHIDQFEAVYMSVLRLIDIYNCVDCFERCGIESWISMLSRRPGDAETLTRISSPDTVEYAPGRQRLQPVDAEAPADLPQGATIT